MKTAAATDLCLNDPLAYRRFAAELKAKSFAPREVIIPLEPAKPPPPQPPPIPKIPWWELTDLDRKAKTRGLVSDMARLAGYTWEDVIGQSRKVHLVAVRQRAMCIVASMNPMWSLPKIGQFFGGRDHTTVLHALRKMGSRGVYDGRGSVGVSHESQIPRKRRARRYCRIVPQNL